MFEIPSRNGLKTLRASADAIRPTTAIGFSRPLETGQVFVPYTYEWGVGAFLLQPDDMLEVLRPPRG